MHVNALSDSRKYLTRGRDRQYTTRMQNANAMVERIKADPPRKTLKLSMMLVWNFSSVAKQYMSDGMQ